ncbi:MAG: hypothetical protein QOK37_2675 [Thermoanaerobaculia bacterium]|jgi:hypothetical protein|nr:hypothetical protein [Thermoanaerobaculia bacterium]
MGYFVEAEYDRDTHTLRLLEPMDGFGDHERVSVLVDKVIDPERPWLALENSLSGEDGEAFARAIEEMFPIER